MFYITIDEPIMEDKIWKPNVYFDAHYTKDWLNNQFAKDVILGIDKSVHIKDGYIDSPVLGVISPRELSTGCKGVLLLQNTDGLILNGERFGDNCFPWLNKLGKMKDIHITLHHFIRDLSIEIDAIVTNFNKPVHSMYELCDCLLEVI